jgi:hypothetical protein
MAARAFSKEDEKEMDELRSLYELYGMDPPHLTYDPKKCNQDINCNIKYTDYKTTCFQSVPPKDYDVYSRKDLTKYAQLNKDCYEKRMNYNKVCCYNEIDPGHVKVILIHKKQEQLYLQNLKKLEEVKLEKKIFKKNIKSINEGTKRRRKKIEIYKKSGRN